ncbi:MAG: Gfo/Idh/MocA family oxidoreductase [Neomegalonema sp.]|nr:Gfo/Idh/MocA family oxidoreductase [Neomegalonema sp.]
MTKICVVGCGNIGSRHLQALARLTGPAEIFCVDPSEAARTLSAERVAQIEPGEGLRWHWLESFDGVPNALDVAVIATGAGPRRMLTEALLAHASVKALLLEKFLFQRHEDYAAVGALLADKGVAAWVNTPRRVWPGWQAIKARLVSPGPITLTVEIGKRNGLASNAIHFIDLAAYLSAGSEGFALRGDRLAPVEGVSRHEGQLEFGGTLYGFSPSGDCLSLRGRPDHEAPHTITLLAPDLRAVVDEGGQKARIASAASNWQLVEEDFALLYQSALTNGFVEAVQEGRDPGLPSFAESAMLHQACMGAFLEAIGLDPQDPAALCRVT